VVYNETTHLNEVRVAFVLAINCPNWPNKHSEELKGLKLKILHSRCTHIRLRCM